MRFAGGKQRASEMDGISAMAYHNPYPPCNYSPPQPQHRKTPAWHVALYVGSVLIAAALIGIFPGSADASPDPIIGDWNVMYGAPATVTMTLAGGVYTETANTPVRVVGSGCDLPPGTVIATFTQTGPSTYAGQHGIWFIINCAFQRWQGMTLSLNSDGNTLTAFAGPYGTFTFTKIL
jgi:hypothetical protein